MAPRWRKALGDVTTRPGRAALAVLALGIGVASLGTLAFKQAILKPVIDTLHGATEPASATVVVETLDDSLVQIVRNVPGVGWAEARPLLVARMRGGTQDDTHWIPAFLYIVRDFEAQRLDLFRADRGAWPPGPTQILLERSAVGVVGASRGAQLTLRLPGGMESILEFAGTVHAQGFAPAWMEHVIYGFVPWNSVVRDVDVSLRILMRVAEHDLQEGHIREVAERVQDTLEGHGVTVTRVDIREPGRHVHASQMNTFLYLVGSFGLMAFLLGCVLAVTTIHALQSEQVRQTGVMKALGATRGQIASIHLAEVGLLALAALAVGVPLGWITGSAYARFSADILNADVSGAPFPLPTLAMLCVVGLVVPLAAGLVPLWRGSRITVREALADVPAEKAFAAGGAARLLMHLHHLPRPLALTLRSAFMRPGRLALTVTMLACGGAMFLSARNVADGWTRAADDNFDRRRYDATVTLATSHSTVVLDSILHGVPGVAHVEYWPSVRPYLIGPEGAAGATVTLLGMDPHSTLLEPKLVAGTWLSSAPGAVFNHVVAAMHPALAVGDTVVVRYEGATLRFPVVGAVKDLLAQPIVYVPKVALAAAAGVDTTRVQAAYVVARDRSEEGQRAMARGIETAFDAAAVEVRHLMRMQDMKGALLGHLVIIEVILTLGGILVVVVGALGLMSTLTINVVQRTREIGVMGAIGARPMVLAFHVLVEALLMALASWMLAGILALPISWALQSVTGRMFFKAPLDFTLSWEAAVQWLVLVVVVASLASLQPALRAARLPVREAIAHVP